MTAKMTMRATRKAKTTATALSKTQSEISGKDTPALKYGDDNDRYSLILSYSFSSSSSSSSLSSSSYPDEMNHASFGSESSSSKLSFSATMTTTDCIETDKNEDKDNNCIGRAETMTGGEEDKRTIS